jgi:hypothetical protein
MAGQKLVHSFFLAVLFVLLSSPFTYSLVDKAVDWGLDLVLPHSTGHQLAMGGCPTTLGLLVHASVFFVVAYYLLH